jgi:AcrR family transcriptional regulator
VSDEQVLAAARAAFIEGGAKVSVSAIAERVGVSHAALFQRFGSKRALMIAALGPPADHPRRHVETPPDERPLRAQLVEILARLMRYFRTLWPAVEVLREAGIEPRKVYRRNGRAAPHVSHDTFATWLRAAQAQGRLAPCDAHALSIALTGTVTVHALMEHQFGERPTQLSDEAYLDAVLVPFLTGLVDPRELA